MNKSKKSTSLEEAVLKIRWKDVYIDGNKVPYQVSDIGLVINCSTKRLLMGSPDKRGYIKVSIYMDNKLHTMAVHRLVAEAFIPNPDNKPTVNHKDGNKKNNNVENLEWMTHKENIQHAIDNGLRNIDGMNAPSNIYTDEQVHEVCRLLSDGKNPKEISELLGVSPNLPRRIKYRGKWKHISSQYNIPSANKIPYNTKSKAFKLLSRGITDNNELIKLLGLPDTPRSRNYLVGIKWKFSHV